MEKFLLTGSYDDFRNHELPWHIKKEIEASDKDDAIAQAKAYLQTIQHQHTTDDGECCLTYLDAELSTGSKVEWNTKFVPAKGATPYIQAQLARPAVPAHFRDMVAN